MTRTILRTGVVAAALAVLSAGFTVPAQAAITWSYMSAASGTYAEIANSTAESGYIGTSAVTGHQLPNSSSNTAASARIASLIQTGAVTTSATAEGTSDGLQLTAKSKVAGVDLLNGLIRVDAVETTGTLTAAGDETSSATAGTQYAGLKIVGVTLPVEIPKNFNVHIPGVAHVVLNFSQTAVEHGQRTNLASAIAVALLQPVGDIPAGALIMVNPVYQVAVPNPPPTEAHFRGFAYGARAVAQAGDADIAMNPTPMVHTPLAGSGGKTLTNSVASLNLPGVLVARTLASTTTSLAKPGGDGEITNTNGAAAVSLFGGLITADAIEVRASGERTSGRYTGSMKMTAVNLKIAGQPIDVNIAPNTTIDVAGLGKVVVNEQAQAGTANRIRGLLITLDTARVGLPAGATIEVAVAATAID